LVGALLKKVRITNFHYIHRIFSRGREDPQEVVSVDNDKSVGWTISLGKASLPINSSGIPEAGVNGCSGFSKPLAVALTQVFGRMGKGPQGEVACQNQLSRLPTSLRKVWLCRIEKAIAKAIPGLSSFLESDGGLQILFQLNMVLTSPIKSFTDTLGFDPSPCLIVRVGREASTHAIIFRKGIEKQRNAQGHVIRGLAYVDFSPFPTF
jgi:hypothetical protein